MTGTTGESTTFGTNGYGYTYDNSGSLVRRGAGYIGDQWYEEDWEGKYVNTSQKFKDLMNDPKSQDMIDEMWDDYQKIVTDPLVDKGKFDDPNNVGYWNPRNAPDATALADLRGMTKEQFVENVKHGFDPFFMFLGYWCQ